MSKCHSSFASVSLTSAYARFRPMQLRTPTDHGWYAA
jgi:hypothetical protein